MSKTQTHRPSLRLLALMALLTLTVIAQARDEAPESFAQIDVVNVREHAWDEQPRFAAKSKTFFRTPNDGGLIYVEFAPAWNIEPARDPLGVHYHYFHEWAYLLSGDFVIHEPVSPHQHHGAAYRFVEGTWLDRPAYSLHGGDWETGGWRPQNASRMIIMEEGDGSVVTLGPEGDHFKPDFPRSKPEPYDPDWNEVEHFPRAWIVHSASDLEWERDREVEGRYIKWLSDDGRGFRARLIKIPPGWSPPKDAGKHYYAHAHRLLYVLYGDLQIWSFKDATDAGSAVRATQDFFVHQPATALWGYGKGPATDNGAVWLEVIYSRGLEIGGGPIQAPVTLR